MWRLIVSCDGAFHSLASNWTAPVVLVELLLAAGNRSLLVLPSGMFPTPDG